MSEVKTIGEQRVRIDFNPSDNGVVGQIKQRSAELINLCEDLKRDKDVPDFEADVAVGQPYPNKRILANSPEQLRLIALAQTAYEEAAMWAVKAATA